MNKISHKRIGFTLIELLVVIAIIAILAAILFPVFATAREKARQTADSSNLHQIGLAFVQYEQDYDEVFPFSVTERYAPPSDFTLGQPTTASGWTDTSTEAATYSIRGLLNPYVKSNGVWHDPSQTKAWGWDGPPFGTTVTASATTVDTIDNPSTNATAWYQSDYGFNFDEGVWSTSYIDPAYGGTPPTQANVPHAGDFLLGGQFYGDGFNGTVNLSKVTSPTTFILGADTVRSGPSVSRGSVTPQPAIEADGKTPYYWEPVTIALDATQASIELRHSGGANFLFSDGHVKWLHPEQTWSSTFNYWARSQ